MKMMFRKIIFILCILILSGCETKEPEPYCREGFELVDNVCQDLDIVKAYVQIERYCYGYYNETLNNGMCYYYQYISANEKIECPYGYREYIGRCKIVGGWKGDCAVGQSKLNGKCSPDFVSPSSISYSCSRGVLEGNRCRIEYSYVAASKYTYFCPDGYEQLEGYCHKMIYEVPEYR